MATSTRQASTTGSGDANHKTEEITPHSWCSQYFVALILLSIFSLIVIGPGMFVGDKRCYFELFAHSVSVSNADWTINFAAKSPITGCKISLHRINSSLFRGHEVISESPPSSDFFGQFVASYETESPVTSLGFNKVVMPEVIGDVAWDIRVEIAAGISEDVKYANGDLMRKGRYVKWRCGNVRVTCGDIPVKFTADSTGNVTGSLLGNMRRCNVTHIVDNLDLDT